MAWASSPREMAWVRRLEAAEWAVTSEAGAGRSAIFIWAVITPSMSSWIRPRIGLSVARMTPAAMEGASVVATRRRASENDPWQGWRAIWAGWALGPGG